MIPKMLRNILLLGVLIVQICLVSMTTCCPAISNSIGNMTKDLEEEVGSSVRIRCHLFNTQIRVNNSVYNVSSEHVMIKLQARLLDNVVRLDERTVEYFIPNATTNDTGYYVCLVKIPNVSAKQFVCMTHVAVGYKPLPVENFSCISEEFSKLICSWKAPYNPVKTHYVLYQSVSRKRHRKCPDVLNATSCQWTLKSKEIYSRSSLNFTFRIDGSNALGTNTQYFYNIQHSKIVKPGAPLSATFSNVGATTLVLHWDSPANMQYGEFKPGLTFSIQYRPLASDPESFKEIRLKRGNVELAGSVEIKDLIPYTEYEFKIRCRSRDSDSDLMWSPYLTISTRTLPDVPYWRPEITNSSFTVESNDVTESFPDIRTITLYWKGLPTAHENGPDFHYVIHVSSRNLPQRVVVVGNETKYSLGNMRVNSRYKFELFASNRVGPSTNISEIVVSTDKLLHGPKDIIVVAKENNYFISWNSPEHEINYYENEVKYYTLFWCRSSIPRPVMCQDSLQWLHLNQTEYNLQLTDGEDYQFAVSANSLNWTSGMFWASCHISFNPEFLEAYEICLNFTQTLPIVPNSGILYL